MEHHDGLDQGALAHAQAVALVAWAAELHVKAAETAAESLRLRQAIRRERYRWRSRERGEDRQFDL
jgi:hypothetical protein